MYFQLAVSAVHRATTNLNRALTSAIASVQVSYILHSHKFNTLSHCCFNNEPMLLTLSCWLRKALSKTDSIYNIKNAGSHWQSFSKPASELLSTLLVQYYLYILRWTDPLWNTAQVIDETPSDLDDPGPRIGPGNNLLSSIIYLYPLYHLLLSIISLPGVKGLIVPPICCTPKKIS